MSSSSEVAIADEHLEPIARPKKKNAPIPMSHQGEIPLATMLPHAGDNIFCLIRMAMVRALDIHEGSKPLVEHDSSDKATSIALNEIAHGKVVFKRLILKKSKTEKAAEEKAG